MGKALHSLLAKQDIAMFALVKRALQDEEVEIPIVLSEEELMQIPVEEQQLALERKTGRIAQAIYKFLRILRTEWDSHHNPFREDALAQTYAHNLRLSKLRNDQGEWMVVMHGVRRSLRGRETFDTIRNALRRV
jgi:hypothetical protein